MNYEFWMDSVVCGVPKFDPFLKRLANYRQRVIDVAPIAVSEWILSTYGRARSLVIHSVWSPLHIELYFQWEFSCPTVFSPSAGFLSIITAPPLSSSYPLIWGVSLYAATLPRTCEGWRGRRPSDYSLSRRPSFHLSEDQNGATAASTSRCVLLLYCCLLFGVIDRHTYSS